ncbi:MAG: methylated-DNA--[protein]-cysteine S-methyltransferase [Elusimicrobiota bacterium]
MKKLPSNIKNDLARYTPFQQKVWEACYQIPKGQVLTYTELAKKINHPHAVRAVGSALAKNPFAPTIPCHRVIRTDGKMGGYSATGGIKKKLQLLLNEGALKRD